MASGVIPMRHAFIDVKALIDHLLPLIVFLIQAMQSISLPMHANFVEFFLLPVLPRPSYNSRTPNKDQKIQQLFYISSPGDIHEY